MDVFEKSDDHGSGNINHLQRDARANSSKFPMGFSLDDRQHPSIFNMSKTDLTIVVLGGDGIGKPLCHSLTLRPSDSDRIDFFW